MFIRKYYNKKSNCKRESVCIPTYPANIRLGKDLFKTLWKTKLLRFITTKIENHSVI